MAFHAILSNGFEKLAEDEVDVGRGHEAAGERSGELRAEADRIREAALGASVEDAE